jgi:hypothetical protein
MTVNQIRGRKPSVRDLLFISPNACGALWADACDRWDNNMKTISRTLLFCTLLTVPALRAATVTVHFDQIFTPEYIDRTVDNGANWYTTDTGLFKFTRTGGTFSGFQNTPFFAFCIEPREFVSVGSNYTYTWSHLWEGTTNIGGMGVAKANLLRELFGRYFPVFTDPIDNVHASALQIAVWEIVRETTGTLDVYNGTVRYRNATDVPALQLAQTYVQSLNGSGPMLSNVFALTLVGAQDLIVQDRNLQDAPVPEPTGTAAAGLLLIGVALFRRAR